MTAIKERSKERQLILRKIDVIEEKHCALCPVNKLRGNKNKKCEGCNNFRNIKKLGIELDKLSNKNKLARSKSARVKTTNAKIQKKEVKEVGKLSIEMYQDYRASGMKDKEIANLSGMTTTALYQFKSLNGLSNKRNAPIEAEKEVLVPVEVKKAIKEEPKQMPVMESDWKPAVKDKKIAEFVAAFKDQPVEVTPDITIIEQQYEIEKWKRESELWKSRHKATEQKFFDLSSEYRKLEVDFRNTESHCRLIEKENSELKETVTLNHLLMKQQVRFLDRLDAMAEVNPSEVGEFEWR